MKKRHCYYFLIPCTAFLLLFVIVPLLEMLFSTVLSAHHITFSGYSALLKNRSFLTVFWRSVRLSVISTVICIIMGFPTSYFIAKITKNKAVYIALSIFPMLVSPVVRSFSWMVILGHNGVLNSLFLKIHIIKEPIQMLYTEFSIVVGLVQLFLPFMILSVVGVMENINDDLILAAENLGAPHLVAFIKVVLPLSIPGIITGSVLVLTGSLTAYTTPKLLGGSSTSVLSTMIYDNAMTLSDWNSAFIIAVVMIITTIIIMEIITVLARRLNSAK